MTNHANILSPDATETVGSNGQSATCQVCGVDFTSALRPEACKLRGCPTAYGALVSIDGAQPEVAHQPCDDRVFTAHGHPSYAITNLCDEELDHPRLRASYTRFARRNPSASYWDNWFQHSRRRSNQDLSPRSPIWEDPMPARQAELRTQRDEPVASPRHPLEFAGPRSLWARAVRALSACDALSLSLRPLQSFQPA